MKKFLSLFLAIIMCFSVTTVAFAEDANLETADVIEENAQEVVDGWFANYWILLDTLQNGENYAHYKYVIDNNKEIQDKMAVYTAFGLYDAAWKNYFSKEVNINTCKQILMAMIEEYSYEMGISYVDYVIEGLEVAEDVASFMEKLNGFLDDHSDILSFVESAEWSTTFQVVNILIDAGHAWQDIREGLIYAYSQIMSVQLANGYYVEMLQYVADNTEYEPMRTAALQLIEEATTAIEEQIAFFLNEATQDLQNQGIDLLLNLAAESNVYTATAKKVFNIGGSVADVLWNTSDQYVLFDALIASYYAENAILDYALKAYDSSAENYDAARAMFGTYATISVRAFGEQSLYNLLEAQNGGIINKIKSKLYDYSCTEYTANMAALDMMVKALFETPVKSMTPIEAVVRVYCPVNVLVYNGDTLLFRIKDGEESSYKSAYGMAKSAYCAYNKEYVKVLFLADEDYKVNMIGVADGYVTFVKQILENGTMNDYSFTEVAITPTTKISVEGLKYTVNKDGVDEQFDLNDVFVMPEAKEVTWETVTEATKEVVEEETKSLIERIREFFANLFAKIKALFGIKDEEPVEEV